jgi:hypothetical protein
MGEHHFYFSCSAALLFVTQPSMPPPPDPICTLRQRLEETKEQWKETLALSKPTDHSEV